ncbi:hypothetical protein NE236_37695 [Actinoallomurus purpureus]|uniref:hypothetical protein n=1 Tax=Actinoallomurus purpureus TaxID=478114 RepID=UPI002093032B|nr:hypothetical protein [Actinoallomurus purpureus]MCO6010708.1 hypothetical protein [Actinoallomurus purpureus]
MRRVFSAAAIAATTAGLIAPATAASATSGWEPYRAAPFTTAGVCPFTIHGDILRDEEEIRTVSTYPDGTPKVQEFRGPLVIRFTNESTGRSAVRDVSGFARLRHRKDGGSVWHFDGGASVRVPAGSRAYPVGWYILQGRFTLIVAPDGTRDFRSVHATVEDLCQTLA